MNMRKILLAVALLPFVAAPALAASSPSLQQQVLCAPDPANGAAGPRKVVNTASTAATQPSYQLNSVGCAAIKNADVGFFLSQGFTQGANSFSIQAGPFTAQSTTTNSPILPAGAIITGIIVQETTGNAITGGLDIGVAGSSDATIASAFAIAANCVCALTDAAILKKVFPTSGVTGPASQQIFFNAHTNWTDTASIVVTILYSFF